MPIRSPRSSRLTAPAVCVAVALVLVGCSTAPSSTSTSTSTSTSGSGAVPGCPTDGPRVDLALSDHQPVPVVRIPHGGCVVVSVPRSPFTSAATTPTRVTPSGVLTLVADRVHPDGTRVASYTATGSGTATVSSTVHVHTTSSVPQWVGIVHIG